MVIATFFSLFLSIVYYQVPSGEKKYKIHYGLRYSLWSLQKKKKKKKEVDRFAVRREVVVELEGVGYGEARVLRGLALELSM